MESTVRLSTTGTVQQVADTRKGHDLPGSWDGGSAPTIGYLLSLADDELDYVDPVVMNLVVAKGGR
jgi:hypothetical protein